jgi:hypothetical protein
MHSIPLTRPHGTLTRIGPVADVDARGPTYLPPDLSNEAGHAWVLAHLD